MITLRPIKGHDSVKKVFWDGQKYRSKSLLIAVTDRKSALQLNDYAGKDVIYFAVSISKRTAKKAVVRNRVKRLLRESLKIALSQVNEETALKIKYIALSWRNAPQHPKLISLKDVLPFVQDQLNKVITNLEKREHIAKNPQADADTAGEIL